MSTNTAWPPAEYDHLLVQMGRIIFGYNCLDQALKAIFAKIATDWSNAELRAKHWIATSKMSDVDLSNAVRTICNEFHEMGRIGDISHELILHSVKTHDLSREYRNWYIHGFNGIGIYKGQPALSFLEYRVKMHLRENSQFLSFKEVKWFADWCQEAHHHVAEAHAFVARDLGYDIGGGTPVAPTLWPLPSKLVKSGIRLLKSDP